MEEWQTREERWKKERGERTPFFKESLPLSAEKGLGHRAAGALGWDGQVPGSLRAGKGCELRRLSDGNQGLCPPCPSPVFVGMHVSTSGTTRNSPRPLRWALRSPLWSRSHPLRPGPSTHRKSRPQPGTLPTSLHPVSVRHLRQPLTPPRPGSPARAHPAQPALARMRGPALQEAAPCPAAFPPARKPAPCSAPSFPVSTWLPPARLPWVPLMAGRVGLVQLGGTDRIGQL